MRPRLRDLFGQIIVTVLDLRAWLIAVPRMDPDSHRCAWYIRAYDVVAKIRAAKAAGTFDDLVQEVAQPPAYWWHRFNWR